MKTYAWHEEKRRIKLERIISFRPANKKEIEVYYEWLSDTNDA